MSVGLGDVTVPTFLDTLRDATVHLDVVHPEALREPLALWFRATEAQVVGEGWKHLLGRSIVPVWAAARAVLADLPAPDSLAAETRRRTIGDSIREYGWGGPYVPRDQ